MKQNTATMIYVFLLGSVFFLGACATQQVAKPEVAESGQVAADDPMAPPVAVTERAVVSGILDVEEQQQDKPKEGVLGLIEKMENDPFTLYSVERGSYTFFVGNEFEAIYKPGDGLTLRQDRTSNDGIECRYNKTGALTTTDDKEAQKMAKACAELMFTFDSQLAE